MGNLISSIRESKNNKKEMVAATVRMPIALYEFVEQLMDDLSKSKQEVLLGLIEEGEAAARKELGAPEKVNSNCRFHILNTNKGNNDDDQEMMLSTGLAAAFYDPWKLNIDRIADGDYVYLYENKVGVVAYGVGTGNTLIRDHEGNKDECHYQQLRKFTLLSQPITAGEIKSILDRNVVFLRTMSGMPDGQKLLDAILRQESAM